MGPSWTWFLWSPSGLTWNTMTLIHIWASPGPVASGPYLGNIATWILSYICLLYTSDAADEELIV